MAEQKHVCAQAVVEIDTAQGLCCPPIDRPVWSSHPRVYLPLRPQQDAVTCYYCATRYVLRKRNA